MVAVSLVKFSARTAELSCLPPFEKKNTDLSGNDC